MAVILLSLMVILSSVEGYRQPFTAFRSHQVDHVHGLGHGLQPGSYKPVVRKIVVAQPSYPRYTPKAVVSQPSYPKYTSPYQGSANVRFQPASQSFASNQGFKDSPTRTSELHLISLHLETLYNRLRHKLSLLLKS